MNWTDVNSQIPKYDGEYLCVLNAFGHKYIHVCSFTKKMEKIEDLRLRGEKGAGFYEYDSEYGYFKRNSVTHWMRLPALP